ncbi:MAG: alpha/beta fold hydrolase [Candidatus Acidiferrales bacterium]
MSAPRKIGPREWGLAVLGVALLAAGAHLIRPARGPEHDTVLDDACRTPLRVLEPPTPKPAGYAVVFHGLSASRRIMQTLGQQLAAAGLRVYLADSPGHGDSAEPFTHARAEQCAAEVVETLERRGEISLDRTVLVGHSMGGAIAIRLVDRFPTPATLAISPAPMILPRRMPANLLIVSASLDLIRLKNQAFELRRAAGGERTAPADFVERRAVYLAVIPRSTHTSLLYDPQVARLVDGWVRAALGEATRIPTAPLVHPVAGSALGLVGLLMMFPLAAGLGAGLFAAGRKGTPTLSPPGAVDALLRWVLVALVAVGALNFWVPLGWLHLMTGAYLASFLLLTGAMLLAFLWKQAKPALQLDVRSMVFAGVLAFGAVAGMALWMNWQLTDAWPIAARWMRLIPLVLACLPYTLAEAVALGSPGQRKGGFRFLLFCGFRLVLWLAVVFAIIAFGFGAGQVLVLLLAAYMATFSILDRLGADAAWRRTDSPAAAALFSAILTAWFFAAVFPLT